MRKGVKVIDVPYFSMVYIKDNVIAPSFSNTSLFSLGFSQIVV